MRGLTRNIGYTAPGKHSLINEKLQIKRILVSRPNHRLGNMLLITPLVQEISATFPNAKIDLFVKGGMASVIFKNYSSIDNIIQLPKKHFKQLPQYILGWASLKKKRYDIVVNVVSGSSSGRLSTQFAASKYKIFGDVDKDLQSKDNELRYVAKYPVYNFREFLSRAGFPPNSSPVPPLSIMLSPEETAAGQKILQQLVPGDKPIISIFTFATGDKCYPVSWWEDFYARLLAAFPQYTILEVLPAENVSQISFKAPTFYSRDIREIGSVIANTKIFIGADSGMMHLAAAVPVAVVGLFSVTAPEIFGPYGHGSVAIDTNKTTNEDLIAIIAKILKPGF